MASPSASDYKPTMLGAVVQLFNSPAELRTLVPTGMYLWQEPERPSDPFPPLPYAVAYDNGETYDYSTEPIVVCFLNVSLLIFVKTCATAEQIVDATVKYFEPLNSRPALLVQNAKLTRCERTFRQITTADFRDFGGEIVGLGRLDYKITYAKNMGQ